MNELRITEQPMSQEELAAIDQQISTNRANAPVETPKDLNWFQKLTTPQAPTFDEERTKAIREAQFKKFSQNKLKKANLYDADKEQMYAILKEDNTDLPPELQTYIDNRNKFLEPLANEFNKNLTKELSGLKDGIDLASILPGASVGFNVGEVAFESAFNLTMDVIPDSVKEKAPVLTNLGVLATLILAPSQMRKYGAKAFNEIEGEIQTAATKLGGLIDNTTTDLAAAVNDAKIDPKLAEDLLSKPKSNTIQGEAPASTAPKIIDKLVAENDLAKLSEADVNPQAIDEFLSGINPNVRTATDIQPKTLEDVLIKHEDFLNTTLSKELDTITPEDIDNIFGKKQPTVMNTEAPTFDFKNSTLHNLDISNPIPESRLQAEAKAIEDFTTALEKDVKTPSSISNNVDEVIDPVQKTNTDMLRDKIASYDLTNIGDLGPGGRAVARNKLNNIRQIVGEVGYDKHINKWLDAGDIDAALLRAEELKANRNNTGIQRPGSPDYKPLSNDYVVAYAAPEIAGAILGAGVASQQEGATIETIAAGALLGLGGTVGLKYLYKTRTKTVTKGNTTTTTIDEVTTTDRLKNLRDARLEEIDVILKNLDDDIKFAGDIRAAKLTETKAIIEKVRETLSNTKSFSVLTTKIKDDAIKEMVKNATKTKLNVPTKEGKEFLVTKAKIEMTEGKVTISNLKRIKSEEDIEVAFGTVEDMFKQQLSKETKSFAEIKNEAEAMNFNFDELNKLYSNSDELAAKIYAARSLSVTLGEEFIKTANKIDEVEKATGKIDQELVLELQNIGSKLAAVQGMVEKSKSNIARATAAMRMTARSKEFEFASAIEIFNALGSGSLTGLRKLAKRVQGKQSLDAHDHMAIKGILQPNGFNMVEEFYLNALLSNPATHIKNAVSNTFTGINSIFTKYAEAGIGLFTKDSVTFKEANAYAFGYLSAVKEAWGMSKMSLKKGEPIIDWIQKEEGMQYQAISKETLPGLGEFGGYLGTVINTPFKALMGSDEFFKTLAFRAEFNASAVKHAQQEVAEGIIKESDLGKRIAELQSNPITDIIAASMDNSIAGGLKAMHRESLENARFLTFTNQLGEVGQGIQKIHQIPLLGKLFFPFIRTPINILKYVGKHTPVINTFSVGVRANLKAGGRVRNKELARMATGSALYTTGYMLSSEGTITGALSSDPAKVASMKAAGIQPNSIKIGNTYYSAEGIDVPFSFFKIATDIKDILTEVEFEDKETLEQMGEAAAAITIVFSKLAQNSTWMESMSELMSLVNTKSNGRPEADVASEQFQKFAASKISSLVPAIVYGLAREEQDAMIEANGILENIKKKIPGLTSEMPIKYDMYGQPIKHASGLGTKISEYSLDPVKQEIASIKYKAGWTPRKLLNTIELTGEQRSFLMKTKGEYFYSYAKQLINSPTWDNLVEGTVENRGSKHIMLDKYDKLAAQQALIELKEKYPEIDKAYNEQIMKNISETWGGQ